MFNIIRSDGLSQVDLLKSDYDSTNTYRNLIVIAGQNSVGKTTIFNTLIEEAKYFGIPNDPQPFSDLLFMLKNLEIDDKQGGINHYHEWSLQKEGKHYHVAGEPIVPFIVTSNKIIDAMFHSFFTSLADAPTGRLHFVEWTGGRNINPDDEPASRADFSFERIGNMLQEGKLPTAWLDRICGVIHPTADNLKRYELNEKKHTASLEQIATGTVSPKKGAVVLDIFGKDDFFMIEDLLKTKGISTYSVNNEVTPLFYERVREISAELFYLVGSKEKRTPQLSLGKSL
jgi:hypothetical protein